MTVYGAADRVTVLPAICGSAAKRRCQRLGADHRNRRAAGGVFCGKKAAAQDWIDAQNPEETGRYTFCSGAKREILLAGVGSDIGEGARGGPHLLNRAGVAPPVMRAPDCWGRDIRGASAVHRAIHRVKIER